MPKSLMPSAYRTHGTTPKGDPRFQCKACAKTFSIGAPTRRHKETTETGEIMRLLVNNVPLRRIREISDIPADRLYHRIDFLADQCRRMAGYKEQNLAKAFADRHRVLSCDVQMLLANWERNGSVDTVPVYHAATVERSTSYIVASTTDYDPDLDPQETERAMLINGDFFVPRAWRDCARTWTYSEYVDSITRGATNQPTPPGPPPNHITLPGKGSRIRAETFQTAHMMLVKKLVGQDFHKLHICIDGDTGFGALACMLFAGDIMAGRVNVAVVRFRKALGNSKREQRVLVGESLKNRDSLHLAQLMQIAKAAYGLRANDPTKDEITPLIAARLMKEFALAPTGDRGRFLADEGFEWRYHRKEEPDKTIYLLTDRGTMSFGDLAILLTRSSMAPVDKYFNQVRTRIKAFDRGKRPSSGDGAWYQHAFYRPEMINKVSTILRFYHNFMLVESEDTGIPKAERRTPAEKIGLTKGKVYMRDLLSFG
ncbi:transposase [Palleronia sp. KMU-117]|uniref:transposase n=1 Tax=Palleronia sp. KMU-117 TaxID=3434108 RepID=UPI003D7106EB